MQDRLKYGWSPARLRGCSRCRSRAGWSLASLPSKTGAWPACQQCNQGSPWAPCSSSRCLQYLSARTFPPILCLCRALVNVRGCSILAFACLGSRLKEAILTAAFLFSASAGQLLYFIANSSDNLSDCNPASLGEYGQWSGFLITSCYVYFVVVLAIFAAILLKLSGSIHAETV